MDSGQNILIELNALFFGRIRIFSFCRSMSAEVMKELRNAALFS